jgi:hypothetical protein
MRDPCLSGRNYSSACSRSTSFISFTTLEAREYGHGGLQMLLRRRGLIAFLIDDSQLRKDAALEVRVGRRAGDSQSLV